MTIVLGQRDTKFDNVPLVTLIKSVQDILKNYKERKKKNSKRMNDAMRDVYAMQHSICLRLKEMDRSVCTFFPVGVIVEYVRSEMFKVIRLVGVVKGHDLQANTVLVSFDEKPEETVVINPMYLKILYMRNNNLL